LDDLLRFGRLFIPHSSGRELYDERRPTSKFTLAPDFAVHGLDHLFDDGQTPAGGALSAGWFGAPPGKLAKQLLLIFRAQTRTLVPQALCGPGDSDLVILRAAEGAFFA
jgi:hypothetical protein